MKYIFSNWTNLRHLKKVFIKTKGFSLIEVLIASAIILTNLGVISSAVVQYGEVSKKQKIITLAIDLEAAIHQVVNDPGSYSYAAGGMIDQMVADNGNFPAGYIFPLKVDLGSGVLNDLSAWMGPLPVDVYLTNQLTNCGATFADKNCVIRLEIEKMNLTGHNAVGPPFNNTPPTYAFAYRIRINPNIQIKVMNLGVNHDVSPFVAADYNLFVPQYILATQSETDCVIGANVTTAGLTGFDRNTGKPICLVQPAVANNCDGATAPASAAGKIAKGLIVSFIGGTSYQIKTRCVDARSYSCPPLGSNNDAVSHLDYSMQQYNPKSLDPAYSLGVNLNRCVFTAADPSTPAAPTSDANVTGIDVTRACPSAPPAENYYLDSAGNYGCSVSAVVQSTQGNCRACTTPVGYACTTWAAPDFWNSTSNYIDTATKYYSGPLVIGVRCALTDNTPAAAKPASCSDPRGLSTLPVLSGTMTFNPTCNLNVGLNVRNADTP